MSCIRLLLVDYKPIIARFRMATCTICMQYSQNFLASASKSLQKRQINSFFKENSVLLFSGRMRRIRRISRLNSMKTSYRINYDISACRHVISVVSPDHLRTISVPAPDHLRIISGCMDSEMVRFCYGSGMVQAGIWAAVRWELCSPKGYNSTNRLIFSRMFSC